MRLEPHLLSHRNSRAGDPVLRLLQSIKVVMKLFPGHRSHPRDSPASHGPFVADHQTQYQSLTRRNLRHRGARFGRKIHGFLLFAWSERARQADQSHRAPGVLALFVVVANNYAGNTAPTRENVWTISGACSRPRPRHDVPHDRRRARRGGRRVADSGRDLRLLQPATYGCKSSRRTRKTAQLACLHIQAV
jgi:hypothetical protein